MGSNLATRLAPHRVTTAQLCAAYPFQAESGLGSRGAVVGQDLYGGGSFCLDPFELYPHVVTSPNMVVAGVIGSGKSAWTKTYLWRQLVFGRRAFVVDVKEGDGGRGEYARLAEAAGSRPVRLERGGPARLNPLDARIARGADPGRVFRDQLKVLTAVTGAALRRDLQPAETAACRLALESVIRADEQRQPTLLRVAEAMLRPDQAAAASVAADPDRLRELSYAAALELGNLCEGELAGMFDGETTEGIDLDQPLTVLDLSQMREGGDAALGILMVCAAAWYQRSLIGDPGQRRVMVMDEAWHVLSELAIARWAQAQWKLARSLGVQNILIIHRLTDLEAAGKQGSEQVKIALGLLSDSETQVVFRQSSAELRLMRDLLRLSQSETDLVEMLLPHIALVRLGQQRRFLVEHRLAPGPWERWIVDTDGRMTA
jgi:type IV secretory pathway VirB4 component